MDIPAGRDRQKQRTRNAIVAAARNLVEHGHLPSVAEVAEAALVSPATAYRYFPDQLSLLRAALTDAMPPMAAPFVFMADETADPAERVARATEDFLHQILQREALVRAVMALSLLRSIDATATREEVTSLRPGYRLALIEEALRPLVGRVAPDTLQQLHSALAIVISSEALVSLQDVAGLDVDAAVAACAWAAWTLVRAVVDDAGTGSSP